MISISDISSYSNFHGIYWNGTIEFFNNTAILYLRVSDQLISSLLEFFFFFRITKLAMISINQITVTGPISNCIFFDVASKLHINNNKNC